MLPRCSNSCATSARHYVWTPFVPGHRFGSGENFPPLSLDLSFGSGRNLCARSIADGNGNFGEGSTLDAHSFGRSQQVPQDHRRPILNRHLRVRLESLSGQRATARHHRLYHRGHALRERTPGSIPARAESARSQSSGFPCSSTDCRPPVAQFSGSTQAARIEDHLRRGDRKSIFVRCSK